MLFHRRSVLIKESYIILRYFTFSMEPRKILCWIPWAFSESLFWMITLQPLHSGLVFLTFQFSFKVNSCITTLFLEKKEAWSSLVPNRLEKWGCRTHAEWEFETYLVKFETYSVKQDYETKKQRVHLNPLNPLVWRLCWSSILLIIQKSMGAAAPLTPALIRFLGILFDMSHKKA